MMLCCPLCQNKLTLDKSSYLCPNGHSFDLAKEGYVNLLPVNQKHSASPGDTKEMVQSRRTFLEKGYYAPFAETLLELAEKYLGGIKKPKVLDIGCGEGYYTRFLKNAAAADSFLLAFDISKWAVKYAAKQNKTCSFAVASAFHIPAADSSADLTVNIFAPFVRTEILRVMRPGSILIYAVPGPRHLFGLKELLYEQPYENEQKDVSYEGLQFLRRVSVQKIITLTDSEDIRALFTMTPYYWKTPKDGARRLLESRRVTTEIHFDFLVYQKTTEPHSI